MPLYRFTLFIAGDSARSQRAVVNIRRLAAERLGNQYELDIVDVEADPERAESERILTTPTLVKHAPLPTRRVTGDLVDGERVLAALSLIDPIPETT